MNDLFEDHLRTDLHTAAGRPAYDSIDPTEVIGEGRRVVRRRHRIQALAAATAVAVIGVGGFLATDAGRTATAPPAHHSTTAPMNRALLTLDGAGEARFLAERPAGGDEVRIIDAAGTDRPVLARLRLPDGGRPLAYTALTVRDSLVGVLPGGSQLLQVSTDGVGEETGYRSDLQPLGDDLVAFAVQFDQVGRLDTLSRLLWADATGMVWDTNTPLLSARFAPAGTPTLPQLLWVDTANGIWGTSDGVGGGVTERPLETWAQNSMGAFEPAGSKHPGRGTFDITGLLPFSEASGLTGTWAPGVTVVSPLQARPLTSGDRINLTAFHAVVTTDGELPEPLLRSITFTGPDGKQHGHSYPAGSRR